MDSPPAAPQRTWLLPALAVLVFFFLLGSRGLNEPDEGRYAEIAREMIERGDWLVPHLWYVPHLDKPPMTYWLVAASMQAFGFNEWAVRLPLALAALSGAWAVFRFGRALGGDAIGRWGVLILISSPLYFAMARMLTTDMILTQFIAWALYFFWRSWRALDALADADEDARGRAGKQSFFWQVAAWLALAGGFLTKGPIALLVPGVAVIALLVFRRAEKVKLNVLLLGAVAGSLAFSLVALPWFLEIFKTVPGSFDFMVKGQAVGHALGTTIKDRRASSFFFFAVLAGGFLPWTLLLGWLWRRAHWRALSEPHKEAWVLMSAWVLFTFLFFSCTSAKLAAYILPLFPALALMVAMRWTRDDEGLNLSELPRFVRLFSACAATLPLIAVPALFWFAFRLTEHHLIWPLVALGCLSFAAIAEYSGKWLQAHWTKCVALCSLASLMIVLTIVPSIETRLGSNQTLKPIGVALREAYRPGDAIVVWRRFAQGLPFYAHPVICATNRPFVGGLRMDKVPFELPGNTERMAPWIVKDEAALAQMFASPRRVLVVDFRGLFRESQARSTNAPVHPIAKAGEWELYSNR